MSLFHAGVMLVKVQGVGSAGRCRAAVQPSSGEYQPGDGSAASADTQPQHNNNETGLLDMAIVFVSNWCCSTTHAIERRRLTAFDVLASGPQLRANVTCQPSASLDSTQSLHPETGRTDAEAVAVEVPVREVTRQAGVHDALLRVIGLLDDAANTTDTE